MQLRYETNLSAEEYVRQKAWKFAELGSCPLHPGGGCSLARHGTYSRKFPEGTKIARWYCREGRTTFGLLPDCLAARLPGTLLEIEVVLNTVRDSTSQEKAADKLREDIELIGALRWIRHRIFLVRAALAILIERLPAFQKCTPTVSCFQEILGLQFVLPVLRGYAHEHLQMLPAPLGFCPKKRFQHKMGTDPP